MTAGELARALNCDRLTITVLVLKGYLPLPDVLPCGRQWAQAALRACLRRGGLPPAIPARAVWRSPPDLRGVRATAHFTFCQWLRWRDVWRERMWGWEWSPLLDRPWRTGDRQAKSPVRAGADGGSGVVDETNNAGA